MTRIMINVLFFGVMFMLGPFAHSLPASGSEIQLRAVNSLANNGLDLMAGADRHDMFTWCSNCAESKWMIEYSGELTSGSVIYLKATTGYREAWNAPGNYLHSNHQNGAGYSYGAKSSNYAWSFVWDGSLEPTTVVQLKGSGSSSIRQFLSSATQEDGGHIWSESAPASAWNVVPADWPALAAPDTGACFHGNGTVLLQSGASKPLSELVIGEFIKTHDAEGKFSFSPIKTLPHANNDEPAAFFTLKTETGKEVDMTSDHYIPKCDLTVVTAVELVVGDCLRTIDGKETLVEISLNKKYGVYTAVTEDKFVVVGGIVASPFSKDSHPEERELDYKKYRMELERMESSKLAYLSRKATKLKE